jgi:hypothetical protein
MSLTFKIGGGIALLVAAFAVGRFSSREPDVRDVERIVYQDRVVEKVVTVTVKEEAKRVVIYRDRVIKPDGTRIEREVEKTETDTKIADTRTGEKVDTREGTKDREHVVTSPLPQWRVGALVGVGLRVDPFVLVPAYGAHVERRIAGPFFVGVWGLHTGTAGLSLSLEF